MLIAYRRTGGWIALIAVAAAAVAAAVLTFAVAAILVITALAIAGVVLLGRAVLPRSWLDRTGASATPGRHEIIDAEVVSRTNASDRREPPGLNGRTG